MAYSLFFNGNPIDPVRMQPIHLPADCWWVCRADSSVSNSLRRLPGLHVFLIISNNNPLQEANNSENILYVCFEIDYQPDTL